MLDMRIALKRIYNKLSDNKLKIIAAYSLDDDLGQSTFVANLAILSAKQNTKTLIIDVDSKRNMFPKAFNSKSGKGVYDYLSEDNKNLNDYLIEVYQNNTLTVFPSGSEKSGNTELLAMDKFSKTFADLEEKYDQIFINVGPASELSGDLIAFLNMTDGLVLVTEIGKTNKKSFHKLIKKIKLNNIPILGYISIKRD